MRIEMRLTRPILVEQELRGVFQRRVQIVVEAAHFFSRRRNEADQSIFQFGFLARPGLKRGDDGNDFGTHNFNLCFICEKPWLGGKRLHGGLQARRIRHIQHLHRLINAFHKAA